MIEAIYGLWLFILKSGLASVYDPSRFGYYLIFILDVSILLLLVLISFIDDLCLGDVESATFELFDVSFTPLLPFLLLPFVFFAPYNNPF